MIPKASFGRLEGRFLEVLLWGTAVVFLGIMVFVWIAAERARPVLLDLETGRPTAQRPAL